MSIRLLSKNAAAAMAQVIVTAALLFELYRFLSRQLGAEQIGVWSLVIASTAVARLGESGIGNGVTKYVAADLGDGNREQACATVGMSVVTMATIIAVLCMALQPWLSGGLGKLIHDPAVLASGQALLPWALVSLWLGSVSQVILNSLDGCQRSDLKTFALLAGGVAQLGAAYVAVPALGFRGLGPVQVAQGCVTMILAIVFLATQLRVPLMTWFRWKKERFFAVLRYGGGVQFASLGILLFDPTIKALLAGFGGLQLTGYYEIVSRAVVQFRAIIAAAYQALVPYMAFRFGNQQMERAQLVAAFRASHELLLVIAIPAYACFAAAIPALMTIWLGKFDTSIVWIGLVSIVGWLANTLVITPYVFYLAIGRLRWNIWSHVAIGVLNVVLASAGGALFGGIGVIVGAMLALMMGSSVIWIAFHYEYGLSFRDLAPPRMISLIATSIIGAGALLWAQLSSGQLLHQSLPLLGFAIVFMLACLLQMWRDPIVMRVLKRR